VVLGRGESKGTRRAIGVRKVRAGRKKASYDRRRTMRFRVSRFAFALHAAVVFATSFGLSACASSQGGRPTLPAPEYEESPVPGSDGGLP
jgi:hypothetical protein